MAKFRFKDYKIIDASIHLDPSVDINKKMNVEITPQSFTLDEDHIYKLQIDTKVSNTDNQFSVFVSIIGTFEFDSDLTAESKDKFFRINAPALLFPYIRAYISTLTSLSGMVPVILPTINMSEMMKKVEEK